MHKKNTILEQLPTIIMNVVSGTGGNSRNLNSTTYIDEFDVDSDQLTSRHKAILDNWAAGGDIGGFPFKPGNSQTKISMIRGMTSQTGSDDHNMKLGKRRAQSVYKYLSSRIDKSQFLEESEVDSVGLTMPRIDQPGAELPINRAVCITVLSKYSTIITVDIPSHATPPPSPHSRKWGISILGGMSVGIDPIPLINVLGGQKIYGRLKNERTGDIKYFMISLFGLDLSVGLSTPVEISVNTSTLAQQKFTPFNTHWQTFEDFDGTWVNLDAASVTNVVDLGQTVIGFLEMNTNVEPEGVTFKTNAAGMGMQIQFGRMKLIKEIDYISRIKDYITS